MVNQWKKFILEAARRPFNSPKSERGMTLLEIIIVITLLGGLMTILVSNLTSTGDAAKEDQARIAMANISQSLQMYKIHNGRLPGQDAGLQALVENTTGSRKWRGPYIEKNKLSDPWGTEFGYESDGRNFKLISSGINGISGDEDDIFYPEEEEGAE